MYPKIFKEKKEHSRSIRMTKTVYDFIEQQQGDGFNDKLDRLIHNLCLNQMAIHEQIQVKENQLYEMRQRIQVYENLLHNFSDLHDLFIKIKRNGDSL